MADRRMEYLNKAVERCDGLKAKRLEILKGNIKCTGDEYEALQDEISELEQDIDYMRLDICGDFDN